ncbi:MAG: MoaD/ThiS family protein [Thermodesulfobacteriota bacterium]
MEVRVLLHGSLRRSRPDYNQDRGLELSLTEGSTLGDLLEHLGLTDTPLMAAVDGRVLKADDGLTPGRTVRLFDLLSGG